MGYHSATINSTGPSLTWIDENISTQGLGYSIGYKKLIQDNLFVQGELLFVNYDDESLISGSLDYEYEQKTRSAAITLGYQF